MLRLAYRHRVWIMFAAIVIALGAGLLGFSWMSGSDGPDNIEDIAEHKGLTFTEAEYLYGWQYDAVGIIDSIREAHPNDYAFSDIRNRQLRIEFMGTVPESAREILDSFSENQGIEVMIVENQGYNESTLFSNLMRVHDAVIAYPGVVDAITVESGGVFESEIIYTGTSAGQDVLNAIKAQAEAAIGNPSNMSVKVRFSDAEGEKIAINDNFGRHLGGENLSTPRMT